MKLAEFFGLSRRRQPDAPREYARSVTKLISECHNLVSERGEVSAVQLAAGILSSYRSLKPEEREQFFDLLIRDFSPDPEKVAQAADAYRHEASPEALARLQRVVEPPRQEMFRRLNMAPGGTRVLVEMRGDLLRAKGEESGRALIASDLGHLLASWFNRGFLVLQRIDWRAPATILEKLIQYEAVHQIHGWHDLRRRLEADRRCYAFFHPALPDDPIIFVEAALTRGMSDKVQSLLDPESPVANPDSADCAVFYSITNCQKGLSGVPFGSFLIKQVVEDLQRELPRIRRFATLSPVPGFLAWLNENRASLNLDGLLDRTADQRWVEDEKFRGELEARLVPLCARYLVREKRGNEPLDPVARFHLRNGARLDRINWLSDTSALGMDRSLGITVNYVYRLGDLERNHEMYTRDYRVAASYELEALAKQSVNGSRPGSTKPQPSGAEPELATPGSL